MTITIKINTDNAAFEDNRNAEVARILQGWINAFLRQADDRATLRDVNGNTVGSVRVTGR